MRHPRSLFFLLLVLLGLTLLIATAAPAPMQAADPFDLASTPQADWTLITVASDGDTGEYPALALDDQGLPHISYHSASTGLLHYSYLTQYGWSHQALDSSQFFPKEGMYSSLALDTSGIPHISFWDENHRTLEYTYRAESGDLVAPATVATGVGETETSLALDKNDRPVIAYFDGAGGNLKVAYQQENGAWKKETADRSYGTVGWAPSLALDPDGYPHISYYDISNGTLKYVARDANGWQTPQVVDYAGMAYVVATSSLALNHLGEPFISYWDRANNDLRLAHHDAERGWQSEKISHPGGAGIYSSLVLDPNGRPHVSYYHETYQLLYVYKKPNGDWSTPINVDNNGVTGIDNALALDKFGNPYFAYFDDSEDDLQAAYHLPSITGLKGNGDCEWGQRYCNPCVTDVVGSFVNMRTYGDILAFHTTGHPNAYEEDRWFVNHWQGAQRLMSGQGKPFVVTLDAVGDNHAVFNTVDMNSRDPGGARWRSNLLAWNADYHETVPSARDTVNNTVWMPSEGSHPGGIQAMGDFLAVGAGRQFYIYDMGNPWQPQQVGSYFDRGSDKSSSTSAMAQLSDQQSYLLGISTSDASSIDFYRLDTASPNSGPLDPSTMTHIAEWDPQDLQVPGDSRGFYYGWDTFQNINLLTECGSGDLYLLATSNLDKTSSTAVPGIDLGFWVVDQVGGFFGQSVPHRPDGSDWASLYSLAIEGQDIVVTKQAEQWLTCGYRDKTYCNLDAAAGVYVDDNHQLYLYSTEHRNDGPQKTVKMMEFRPLPHGSCANVEDGWLELYENDNYYGRSLMIDWIDRDRENYENYDEVEDFEDKASSAAWCLPHDWSVVLYEHKKPCAGKETTLRGTGAYRMAQLDTFGSNNDISCSRFYYDPPRIEVYDPQIGVTLVYYPPQTARASLAGSANSQAATPDRSISLTVPPDALQEQVTLTLSPVSPPTRDTWPLAFAGSGFSITATKNNAPLTAVTFEKAATANIRFREADLAGLDPASLGLYYWDDLSAQWAPASHTCSAQAGMEGQSAQTRIMVSVCKLGEYALLANPLPRRVLVDEMHDNLLTLDWARAQDLAGTDGDPRWFYLDQLRDNLALDFNLFPVNEGKITPSLLANLDVLLIPHYNKTMTPEEITAIRNYVAAGGGLILLGEAYHSPANEELAASYGFKHLPHILFSPAPDAEPNFDLRQLADPLRMAGIKEMTFSWGQTLSLSGQAEPLARTPPQTWIDLGDDWVYDEGDDPTGEFIAAGTVDSGCGRVVVLGDDAFSDSDLDWTQNDQGMRALLSWAAAGRSCSISESLVPQEILLDESHDNQLTLDWARAQQLAAQAGGGAQPGWYHLGDLQSLLAADFHLQESYGAPLTAELLAAKKALIIPPNAHPLTAAEQAAVKQYVTSGGGLVLIGNCGYQDPSPALAAAYGIAFDEACLFAPTVDSTPVIFGANYANLPWLDGVDPLLQIYGQSLSLSGHAFTLLDSLGNDAWSDANGNETYDQGEEGLFNLMAGYDTGCGRVAAIADSQFCDDCLDVSNRQENDVLMRAVLRWVTSPRSCQVPGMDHNLFMPVIKRR